MATQAPAVAEPPKEVPAAPPVKPPEPPAAVPIPEQPSGVQPPPEIDHEADRQAVDAFLKERTEKNRIARGGRQAKIEQLTKEKHEAEEKAVALAKEAEDAKKALEEAKKAIPPKPEVAAVQGAPKMEDFGNDASAYQAALALWVAEQSKPPVETKPSEAPQHLQVRKEEFDRFLERGKVFVTSHPDFDETLKQAHIRGLTLSEEARVMITKLAVPEVAYWLAKPENDLAARALMGMDNLQQVAEVGRIAERLHVSPADFVSSAPPPGIRLTGNNAVQDVPLDQVQDTDEYIRRRKLERRNGRGR